MSALMNSWPIGRCLESTCGMILGLPYLLVWRLQTIISQSFALEEVAVLTTRNFADVKC